MLVEKDCYLYHLTSILPGFLDNLPRGPAHLEEGFSHRICRDMARHEVFRYANQLMPCFAYATDYVRKNLHGFTRHFLEICAMLSEKFSPSALT